MRKEDNDARVYIIRGGKKCWVPSPAVLFAIGKTWADVRVVPDGGLHDIQPGPDVHVHLLKVSVTPYPIRFGGNTLTVTRILTVNATDLETGALVAGKVEIDGNIVSDTNTSFTYTFTREKEFTGHDGFGHFVWNYPDGMVTASTYPDESIEFGFN